MGAGQRSDGRRNFILLMLGALALQPGRVVTKVGHFDAYDLLFVAPQDQAAPAVNQSPAVAQ